MNEEWRKGLQLLEMCGPPQSVAAAVTPQGLWGRGLTHTCVAEDLQVTRCSHVLQELMVILATENALCLCFPDALPSWDIAHRAFWWPPELGTKAPLRPLRIHRGEKHQIQPVAGRRAQAGPPAPPGGSEASRFPSGCGPLSPGLPWPSLARPCPEA